MKAESESTDGALDRLEQPQSDEEWLDGTACEEGKALLSTPLRKSRPNGRLRCLAASVFTRCMQLSVLVLALLGVLSIFTSISIPMFDSSPSGFPTCYCGETDAQAEAMGCTFDHLAVDWLPASCIDAAVTDEFVRSGPNPDGSWTFYADWDLPSSHLNAAQMEHYARTGRDYYATKGWHVAHCMFTLRKQFRARELGTILEPWNNKEEHVLHCLEYVMDNTTRFDEIETKIPGWDRHGRGERGQTKTKEALDKEAR